LFLKNKSKGQTSIEILAILGVLVIGGIILGTFYLQNINKKTAEATEISNIDYSNWIDDVNYTTPTCGNDIIELPEKCDGTNMGLYTGLDCSDIGLGSGDLSCNSCSLDYSDCSGAGICGDGFVNQASEQCDSPQMGSSSTCEEYNPLLTGTLGCNVDCTYNLDGCLPVGGPVCGDAIINGTEVCDYPSFGGLTCEDFKPGTTGDLKCIDNCQTIDFSDCSAGICGDNLINQPSEECDGTDMGKLTGMDCSDLGLGTGSLSCTGCLVDFSGCSGTGICGDNLINQPSEECDGSNLNGQDCVLFGYSGGTLACYNTDTPKECTFDTSGCNACGNGICDTLKGENCVNCPKDCTCSDCGNGVINSPPEQCDTNGPVIPGFLSCEYFGYSGGSLGCIEGKCLIDTSGCIAIHTMCGDGICSVPGECLSCPADCNVGGIPDPGCVGVNNSIKINLDPMSGSSPVGSVFAIDTNTEETVPDTTLYTLVVGVMSFIGDWVPSSECRYNGGAYQSSITIGSGLSVGIASYNFNCKTAGTYRLTFTVTNDANASDTASKITDWSINPAGTIPTPVANPVGGTYQTSQNVTLTSSPPGGVKIHYTTNGSNPTCSTGLTYSSPINIPLNTTRTIKAIGCKLGWTESGIMSQAYTITGTVSAPVASPGSGTYATAKIVTLTSDAGAQIRYTTDGSTPDGSSNLYSYPIVIYENTILKSKAYKTSWTPSSVTTDNYTITTNYCGDIDTNVYTPHPSFNGYCDTPINIYALASESCEVTESAGSFEITYTNPILNGQVIKGPYLGEPTHPEADLFCAQHGFTYIDGTVSSTTSGTPWYLRTQCSASGPLGTNQWIAGNAPNSSARVYTSITCGASQIK